MSLPHRCIHVLWGLRRAPASSSRDSADPRSSRSPREAPVRRQRMPVQYSRRRGAATPPTGTARHDVLVAAAQLRVRHAPRLLWPAPAASRAQAAASTERSTPSIDPRGAAAAGGYTSARSAHRVDAGRAPPAFEPEAGGSACPPCGRRCLHTSQSRGAGGHPPPAPAAPSAARARNLGGTLTMCLTYTGGPPLAEASLRALRALARLRRAAEARPRVDARF